MGVLGRRRSLSNSGSFLRIRDYTQSPYNNFQVRPPSWTGGGQGNMNGYYLSNDRSTVYMLSSLATALRIYSNGNTNGIIEYSSDLSYVDQTNSLQLTTGTHGFNFIPRYFWIEENSSKIFAVAALSNRIVVYDFNTTTNTVTYDTNVVFANNVQGFYFSPDGLKLFTSNESATNNLGVHVLSVAFDISSITSSTWSTVAEENVFRTRPEFFNNGSKAFLLRTSGTDTKLVIGNFSTPYEAQTMSVYANNDKFIDLTGFTTRVSCRSYLPIYLSYDLKQLMYGNQNFNTVGSRIGGFFGVGDFDFPVNYESGILAGNGNLIN